MVEIKGPAGFEFGISNLIIVVPLVIFAIIFGKQAWIDVWRDNSVCGSEIWPFFSFSFDNFKVTSATGSTWVWNKSLSRNRKRRRRSNRRQRPRALRQVRRRPRREAKWTKIRKVYFFLRDSGIMKHVYFVELATPIMIQTNFYIRSLIW